MNAHHLPPPHARRKPTPARPAAHPTEARFASASPLQRLTATAPIAISPPITLPSSLADSVVSPARSRGGRDQYRTAANTLDSLLDEALGQFGGGSQASGSFLGGSVASFRSAVTDRSLSPSSGFAIEVVDDDLVAASRQDGYRSRTSFHLWCSLLCYVEPGFATAARRVQIDSWALSSFFGKWALEVRGRYNNSRALEVRGRNNNNSRPSSPVDQPSWDLEVRASAVFGAWAGEARARAQERISITSHAIGAWCVHTQRVRRMRDIGEAAEAIARGRGLAAARQVLLLWQSAASDGARHALGQTEFADRWADKHRRCEAFLAWRSFSSGKQLELGIESFLKENVSDNAYESHLDEHVSAMPATAPDAEEIAAPKNAALDEKALDEKALDEKAEHFCASRLMVRVAFFFTFWAQMRGTMTPRDRDLSNIEPEPELEPEPEREPARAQVTELVAEETSSVVKPAARKPTDDPEQWLLRQAGVISSDSSDEDDTETWRKRRGNAELTQISLAEFAVDSMLAGPTVSVQVEVEAELEKVGRTARQEQLVAWAQRQHVRQPRQTEPPLLLPPASPIESSVDLSAATDLSSSFIQESDEVTWAAHVGGWMEWYFRGEWWPGTTDADVAAERAVKRVLFHQREQLRMSSSVEGEGEEEDDVSWGAHLLQQAVWYAEGGWWAHVERAPRDLPAAASKHVQQVTRTATLAGHLAVHSLGESAVVVGGAVIWEGVALTLYPSRNPQRHLSDRGEKKDTDEEEEEEVGIVDVSTADQMMSPFRGQHHAPPSTATASTSSGWIAQPAPLASARELGESAVKLSLASSVLVGWTYLALRFSVAAAARRR